jgi:hypothetical protein
MDSTGILTRAGCVHVRHGLEARNLTIFLFLCGLPSHFHLSFSHYFSSPDQFWFQITLHNDMERIARTYCKDAVIPSSGKTAVEEAIYQEQPRELDNVVITLPTKLWSRGRQAITYGWIDGEHSGSQAQRQKVAVAIEEWEWYSNVSFIAAGDSVARPDIVISFDPSPSQGTWSLVGTDCLKAAPRTATMNLGCIGSDNEMAAAEKAVILHQVSFYLVRHVGSLADHPSSAMHWACFTNINARPTVASP